MRYSSFCCFYLRVLKRKTTETFKHVQHISEILLFQMKLRRQQNLQRRPRSMLCGWEALGEEDLQEGNQNHWNSIPRSRGDDPTFRGSLRRSASRLAARSRLPPRLLQMHAHKHSDGQACLNISSTRV